MQRYALVLAVASLFALPVQGAVTLTSSTGGIEIGAQVGVDPILPATQVAYFSHNVPRPDSGLFQQSLYDVRSSAQYGTVSAMASQVSSFSLAADGQLTGASFAGTSAVTAATFDPYGSNTLASSTLSFVFQVTDTPVDYDLFVSFAPLGFPGSSALQIWNLSTNALVEAIGSDNATASGNPLSGTLQPGWYRLSSWTFTGTQASTTSNVAWASSMTYNLTLTPEPGSLALLALGAAAVLRPRRLRTLSQTRTSSRDAGTLFEVGGHAI